MDQQGSSDIAVYVVWSSQLGAEEKHVPEAAELVPDRRARHFWDPNRLAGKAFVAHVNTPMPAWDVWMLFDRQTRWEPGKAPVPAWWEHQLRGLAAELHLDPARFAAKAAELLSHPPAQSGV